MVSISFIHHIHHLTPKLFIPLTATNISQLIWLVRASSVYNSRGEFYAKYKRFTTVSKHLIDELGIPRGCVPRSLSERSWNGNQARLLSLYPRTSFSRNLQLEAWLLMDALREED
jgi:hypothetical protein